MSKIIYEISTKTSNKDEDISLVEQDNQLYVYVNKEIVQIIPNPACDYIKNVLNFSESHLKSMNEMLVKQRQSFLLGSTYLKEELRRLYSDERTPFDETVSGLLKTFKNVWCAFFEGTVEFAYWDTEEKEENIIKYLEGNGFTKDNTYFVKDDLFISIRKSKVISDRKTSQKKAGFVVKIVKVMKKD